VSKLASEEKISLDQNNDSMTQPPSKPVGRVYYSGRSDVSVNARELLPCIPLKFSSVIDLNSMI
jgi:hypothetical protein